MKKFIVLYVLILFLAGCSKQVYRNYYLIDYVPYRSSIFRKKYRFPYRVVVKNLEISSLYDHSKIVIRRSMHRIQYDSDSIWPIRPQYAIRDLIIKHLRVINLFQEVDKEFLNVKPDYAVVGTIYAIEYYSNPEHKIRKASLEMKLTLQNYETGKPLVNHEYRRSVDLLDDNMNFFVKAISDIVLKENTLFFKKLEEYFAKEVKR